MTPRARHLGPIAVIALLLSCGDEGEASPTTPNAATPPSSQAATAPEATPSPAAALSEPASKAAGVLELRVENIKGKEVALGDYRGKVLMIVNTASECGFTSQYTGLQELHGEYADDGLLILGFPSNDFGGQEPEPEA
jgi:glutathione peroxidase